MAANAEVFQCHFMGDYFANLNLVWFIALFHGNGGSQMNLLILEIIKEPQ